MDNTDNKQYKVIARKRKVNLRKKTPVKRFSLGSEKLSELIPFTGAMIKGLKTKGINVSGFSFPVVVAIFHREFVPGSTLDVETFVNNVLFRVNDIDQLNVNPDDLRVQRYIGEFDVIKQQVLNVFISAKERYFYLKSAGIIPQSEMSVSELCFVNTIFKVQNQLMKEERLAAFETKKDSRILWLIVIILSIFVIAK